MTKVRVGLVGCGFVAELHMYAYQRVYGLDAQLAAVAARGDHVLDFAKKHQIRRTHRDFKSLLADKKIDVVDICTPPALHAAMIVEAMQAGKHVICEKPFTGYLCVSSPLLQDLSFFRLFLLRYRLKRRSALMSQRSLVMNTCTTKFRPPISSHSQLSGRWRRARCSRAG